MNELYFWVMRRWMFMLFLMCCGISFSQEMHIGLIRSIKIQKLTITPEVGQFHIFGDTSFNVPFSGAVFQRSGNSVLSSLNGKQEKFDRIIIVPDTRDAVLKVKCISPASREHMYHGSLELEIRDGRINLVNIVDINQYLSGVIESEGGGGRHLEYYKVQALMSRTYAMLNRSRHKKDGFELCDGVHCQAYHNMLKRTPSIQRAVNETSGEVIVDQTKRLVSTYFSANCGGQTCDASYVWNNSVHYITSFVDTFCIHTRQAKWTKSVSKSGWKQFIEDTYGIYESDYGDLLYNFKQEQRKAFFIHPSLGIPLRDLRRKFKLKSIFFDTRLEGNEVVITGRGFGHGVGLCQEGAMNMAKAGYSYKQIALFYFDNVRILNYYRDQFFSQQEDIE